MISIENNVLLTPPLFGISITDNYGAISSLVGTTLTFEAFVPVHSTITRNLDGTDLANRYSRSITHLGNPEKVQDLNSYTDFESNNNISEYSNKSIIKLTRLAGVEPIPAGVDSSVSIYTPLNSERAYNYSIHSWGILKDDFEVINHGSVYPTSADAIENLQLNPKFWLAEVPSEGFIEQIYTKTVVTDTVTGLEKRLNTRQYTSKFKYSFICFGTTAERYKNIGLIKDTHVFVQVDWRYPTKFIPFVGNPPNTNTVKYIQGTATVGDRLAVLLDGFICSIGTVETVSAGGGWYTIRMEIGFPNTTNILYVLPTLDCDLLSINEEFINIDTSKFHLEVKVK